MCEINKNWSIYYQETTYIGGGLNALMANLMASSTRAKDADDWYSLEKWSKSWCRHASCTVPRHKLDEVVEMWLIMLIVQRSAAVITGFIQIISLTKLLKLNDCSHAFVSPLSICRKHVVNSTVRFHFHPADPRKQLSVNWPGLDSGDSTTKVYFTHPDQNFKNIKTKNIFLVSTLLWLCDYTMPHLDTKYPCIHSLTHMHVSDTRWRWWYDNKTISPRECIKLWFCCQFYI